MTQTSVSDKRQHIRIPSSRPVVLIINNQNLYATMTDFSKHGIGFISTISVKAHDRIEVHFAIPTSYTGHVVKAFQFKAEVRHCLCLSKRNHIGVKLDFPTEEYLLLFEQLSAT